MQFSIQSGRKVLVDRKRRNKERIAMQDLSIRYQTLPIFQLCTLYNP